MKTRHTSVSLTVALALVIAATSGSQVGLTQQNVPFRNNIPVAPRGLAARPLPDKPVEFDTAEDMKIRVVVVTKALEYPWSLTFLPDSSMLVTERAGRLRIIRNGVLDPMPVTGTPVSRWAGISGEPGAVHGYMDVALHPRFAENKFVYLSYTKPVDEKTTTLAIARGKWDGRGGLTETKDIFVSNDSVNIGAAARLAFGRDNTLYVTTAGNGAQDPNSLAGKVLRLKDDGTVPSDNPFVGRAGYRPEVFTLGHRSSLGLAMHPVTGEIWLNENGPNGGDEINILKPGGNYGWPLFSLGRTYTGPWQSQVFQKEGFEPPLVYWTPAIAVSGMAFYTGDKLAKWKGDVFVGSLRTGEIPGTGHLERILFNEKMEELRREALLRELRQRIRDVRQGPDGLLYLLTDEKVGAVLRIEPADSPAPKTAANTAAGSGRGTPYSAPKTPWGDPDLQAIWSGDSAFGIPLQRAVELGDKGELTDDEFAAKLERDAKTRKTAENAVGSFRNDNAWLTRSFKQTSLIVDPPNGRAPALVAGADKRRTPQGTYGNGPFNGPEDFTLYDRCVTLGVVGSMTPKIYGNGYRIVQAPGYAVIMAEMIHESRVIPLDGRPHVGSQVRGYLGDSRGHWEGNTLVVETTNFNGKATVPGNPVLASTELKIVERITRVEADLLRYEATITDPKTYERPFTISIPYTSPPGYQVLPYECHEGNLAILQALGGERAEDNAVAEDARRGIIRPRRPVQGGLTVGGQPIAQNAAP